MRGYDNSLIGIEIQSREVKKPSNFIEEELLKIWTSALNIKSLGTDDNFYDVGGQSIGLMKIIVDIEKRFQLKVDYKTFIKTGGTIEGLAEYILLSRVY